MDVSGVLTENGRAGDRAVKAAKKGDFSGLAERLRDQKVSLSLTERVYLAALITGEFNNSVGRPKAGDALLHKQLISVAVYRKHRRKKNKVEQAQIEAATELGVSARTIRNHLRNFHATAPKSLWMAAEFIEMSEEEADAFAAEIAKDGFLPENYR